MEKLMEELEKVIKSYDNEKAVRTKAMQIKLLLNIIVDEQLMKIEMGGVSNE